MKELAKFMELNLNPVDSLDFGSIELKSYVSLIAAHIQELEVDQAVKKLYYFEAFVCLSFHLITFSKVRSLTSHYYSFSSFFLEF